MAACRRRGLLLGALVVLVLAVDPGAARAIETCKDWESPQADPDAPAIGVAIDISEPSAGARVSGASSIVGTARSSVPLSRAELRVAGAVVASEGLAPGNVVDFVLPWDAGSASVGQNTVEVLVCGEEAIGGAAVGVTVPPRYPVWVGLVVGTAGVAGLALSFAFRRDRPSSRARRAA